MKSIEIPPYAPTLMESTRAIGYTIEAAIADIIDNSISANASRVDIDFFPIGKSYISVLDNGDGMSFDDLLAAMQYGSKNPTETRDENDLGRYGLGMKTASLSQCRILSVITKQGDNVFGCQWNLNHVNETQKWSLIVLEESEICDMPDISKLAKYDSGTVVVWQDLDKFAIGEGDIADAFSRKMDVIREHLSLVFHRYLSGEPGIKKLDIKMNGLSVVPQDPFLIKKSTQLMDAETIVVRGEKITVKPYILPHTSKLTQKELKALGGKDGLRKQQGFYVYRNKRLLVWGTWFKLMRQGDLSKLARVQVDIPNSLDDLWTLDIKKSKATPPEEVRKNLSIVVGKIADGSKRTWTYRGKKETQSNIIHLWDRMVMRDGGITYELNSSHPTVQAIKDKAPQASQLVDALLREITLSLPLNSLYIDLTNDEKIANESEIPASEAIEMAKSILCSCTDKQMQESILTSLLVTEPFSAFAEDIQAAFKAGVFND